LRQTQRSLEDEGKRLTAKLKQAQHVEEEKKDISKVEDVEPSQV